MATQIEAHHQLVKDGRSPSGIARIPDERVLAMIASCAKQVAHVASIQDAKEASSMAEAVAAVARKVNVAKEIKHAAARLLLEAEIKLGELTRQIPRKKANQKSKGRRSAEPTKEIILAQNGISKNRANVAERLARVPREKIDEVVASGKDTIHGLLTGLGLQSDVYYLRIQKASNIAFLCRESLDLLTRSVERNQVPHAGTVAEMNRRWDNIVAHKNEKRAT